MTKKDMHIKIFYIFLVICIFILIEAAASYARSNLSALQGETEYAAVESVDKDYITTTEGRFTITKDTKMLTDQGVNLTYRDIKMSSTVRMRFKRTGGQLVALDIVVKTSETKIMPE